MNSPPGWKRSGDGPLSPPTPALLAPSRGLARGRRVGRAGRQVSPRGRGPAHLVPGVGAVGRVDEDGQDLGLGQQGGGPPGRHVRVEVVGALLKVEVGGGVGGDGEEVHVPAGSPGRLTGWAHEGAAGTQPGGRGSRGASGKQDGTTTAPRPPQGSQAQAARRSPFGEFTPLQGEPGVRRKLQPGREGGRAGGVGGGPGQGRGSIPSRMPSLSLPLGGERGRL